MTSKTKNWELLILVFMHEGLRHSQTKSVTLVVL